jgi:hypothetical protein
MGGGGGGLASFSQTIGSLLRIPYPMKLARKRDSTSSQLDKLSYYQYLLLKKSVTNHLRQLGIYELVNVSQLTQYLHKFL